MGVAGLMPLELRRKNYVRSSRPVYEHFQTTAPQEATLRAYQVLFWSCFVFSIAQGLYEAVINPLIARLHPENPTHYLNILHAGWPGGMIVGGLIAAGFIGEKPWISGISFWEIPLTSFALAVVLYGVLAMPEKFPQTVAAKTQSFGELFSCFLSPIFILLLVLHACIGYTELGIDFRSSHRLQVRQQRVVSTFANRTRDV
jgi:MFS family permease